MNPGAASASRGDRVALVAALAALASVVGLAVASVHGLVGGGADTTRVVLPGNERAVLAALRAPVHSRAELAGHRPGDVRIERDGIVVALEDLAPASPGSPTCHGTLTIRHADSPRDPRPHAMRVVRGALALTVAPCAATSGRVLDPTMRTLAESLADGPIVRVFAPAEPEARRGLLGPTAALLGIGVTDVFDATLAIATCVALLAALATPHRRRRPEEMPREPRLVSRRARAAFVALVLVGGALRCGYALATPFDVDETWSRADGTPVFTDRHDAWVHPPLGRAFALAFGRVDDDRSPGALFAMRLPFLGLGLVATFALVRFTARRLRTPSARDALLAAALVVLSSATIEAGVLARPYAIVQLGASVLFLALVASGASRLERFALGWTVAVVALTDLVAGAFAFLGVAAFLLAAPLRDPAERLGREGLARVATAVAGLVPLVAMIPGWLVAWRTQLAPAAVAGAMRGPDLRPASRGLGEWLGVVPSTFAPLVASSLVGGVVMLLLGRELHRRGARRASRALVVALVALVLLGLVVAMRPRNLAFLPWFAALLLVRAQDATGPDAGFPAVRADGIVPPR